MSKKVVFIAGGGTGGHVYPGLAIAQALKEADSSLQIHFVGNRHGLETKLIPKEGYPLHLIAGGKLNFSGRPWTKLLTLMKIPWALIQSWVLLMKWRPCLVVGVGGYASGPFLLAACWCRFKTALWEANAHPGLANQWLSRWVPLALTVFPESRSFLRSQKVIEIGMPVRPEIEAAAKAHPILRQDSHAQDFHVFHFGGSQGSRPIGRALCQAILKGGTWLEGIQIFHQTGTVDADWYKEQYAKLPNPVAAQLEFHEFVYDMVERYQWADMVICRGGASTLAELAAMGIPALVIPLPLADGHQEKNALSLESKGAVKVLLQKDLTPERLIQEIGALRVDLDQRKKLAVQIRKLFHPQAAQQIAKQLLECVR